MPAVIRCYTSVCETHYFLTNYQFALSVTQDLRADSTVEITRDDGLGVPFDVILQSIGKVLLVTTRISFGVRYAVYGEHYVGLAKQFELE